MKYIVISPMEKLMCFNEASQVANYCMQITNDNVNKYADEEQLTFENMTPVEIGFAYNTVGMENASCKVYKTVDVLKAMQEEGVDILTIKEVSTLFDTGKNYEVSYPTYLNDILSLVTPVSISSISGNVYTMENVDGTNYFHNHNDEV